MASSYDPLDLSVFAGTAPAGKVDSRNFNPLDLSGFDTEENRVARENSSAELAAQVDVIAKDYASRGEPLNDTEVASLYQALARGEDWTRPKEQKADFSDVQGGSSTAPPVIPSFLDKRVNELKQNARELGAVLDTTQAGLQQAAGGALLKASDSPEQIKSLLNAVPSVGGLGTLAGFVLPDTQESKDKWANLGKSFLEDAAANTELAEPIKQEAMARGGEAWKQYVETVFDVAGSPSSAASLIGGPAAAVPFMDVYLREYGQARDAGLSPEQADVHALGQAVPEGVISILPAGKVLGAVAKRIPGVNKVAGAVGEKLASSLESRLGQAINTAAQTAKTAIGEGAEEGVTFMAQDAANRLEALVGPEKARDYAQKQVVDSQDYAAQLWRNARAGAAMGGPVGAIEGAVMGAREGAQMSAEREEGLTNKINTELGNRLLAEAQARDKADVETTQDIALEERRIANEEAKRQAFEQAEKASAEQRELEQEAGFQTLERGPVTPTTRVERYADVVERVPVQPAREVTAEDVAEQRAAAQRAEAERQQRVEQGKLVETLKKRKSAILKAATAADKKAQKAATAAETKRRNAIADQLVKENPDASEADLVAQFKQRLAAPIEQTPTTQQPKAPAPIVKSTPEKPAPANVIPAPTKTDKSLNEQELDSLAEKMGLSLGMAATKADLKAAGTKRRSTETEETTEQEPLPTIEDFKPKVGRFVKALVGRKSSDSRDLQTLIHQGKIVVSPNAKVVGREEAGRVAEYDTNDGKMYIYLDALDKAGHLDAPVRHIAAAVHEATHALITPEEVNAAAGIIRAAANKGNKLAKNAVADARADSLERAKRRTGEENPQVTDEDTQFENEEAVAYLANRVKEEEGKPLGTIGAVVRNLTGAAKEAIRKNTRLDLKVTLSDVAYALQQNLKEATKRDITGRNQAGSLAMIGGEQATGFKKAQQQGRTFKPTADFMERFEFGDDRAELTPPESEGWTALANNKSTTLDKILLHDELAEQYPDLTPNIKVEIDPKMPANTSGMYLNGKITLPPSALLTASTNREELRNTLLHETQHAIQEREGFVPGTNKDNFIPKATSEMFAHDKSRVSQLANSFELGAGVAGLRPAAKAEWDALVKEHPGMSAGQKALMFVQEGFHEGNADRNVERQGNRLLQANENLKKSNAEYYKAEKKAFQIYLRDRGEAEARNVEARSRMTQAERDALPFESTIGQDIGVTSDELLDSTPFVGRPERAPVASESLGMAAPVQSQAFKDWFGGSQATDDNGAPKVYYSGTSKDKDFHSFNVPKNGAWFAADPKEASMYAVDNDSKKLVRDESGGPWALKEINTASRVFPVYLRVENPYMLTPEDRDALDRQGYKKAQADLFSRLKAQGYDSVIWDSDKNIIAILDSPTQIKSVFNENPTNKSKDVLGMAASQTPKAKVERRDPTVVKWQTWARNLFQNSKGLGPQILESFEFAKSSPAGEEARANAALGRYNDGLRELAKQRNTTMEALNEQIMEELDDIDDKVNGYDANIAAYKAVVSKYGKAGAALLDLRNQVDALTREMLRLRAASNVKPSAEEAKTLTTLINNSGRYSHRLYAAHQGAAGKKYANAIMDVYEKGRKGKKPLTPAQKDTYDMVERALKTLIDDSLMIPDDAAIAEMGGDQLTRLYKTWGQHKTGAVSLDEMRDELASIRDDINGDTDRLRVTAEEIASELLGLTDAQQPVATYFRGGKQDRGILQERSKIPANIRALMGEITDPGTRLLATVAKQAEFVARTKFLLEVKNNAGPEHLQPPNATGTPAVINNSMQRLSGEGYGALDGWYASPQLRSMLSDIREVTANFEQVTAMAGSDPGKLTSAAVDKALEKWMQVAGISKRAQIVGNLFLMPLNFMGAVFAPLISGNINPVAYGKGLQDAVHLIRYAIHPSSGLGTASDAVTYGVTDSATVGELKGLPYEKIKNFAKQMAGTKPSQALRVAKSVGMTLQESYAMMDVWAKIANFHNEVRQLESYYKKNGETRTEEQIKREAADITNRTNITYKRAVPVIKALERGGITNFGTYFYEVFRSQINNFAQGVKEATVDAAKAKTASAKAAKIQRGLSRVGGQTAYWYMAGQLSRTLAQMMFGDDEDEWDKRSLLPEYMQNQDLFPVGLDAKGKPVLFSVSRVDAFGPATDIMRQAMTGGLSMEQAKEEMLNLYVKPRLVPQIAQLVTTLAEDTAPTRKPLVQQLAPTGYETMLKGTRAAGVEDKTVKAWTNLVEAAFGPGTLSAYRDTNPTPVAPAYAGGEGLQQTALVAKYMGATFQQVNPNNALFFANKEYEDTVKIGRKDLGNAFKDRPNITDDEILSFVNEARQAEEAKWNELARMYRGMKAYKMSDKEINAAMKDAGLDASTIKSMKSQRFEPSSVSKKSFEQQINVEIKKLDAKEQKAFKKEWEKAWKRLSTLSEEESK